MADRDYDMGPATELMVNDFDDERTLDEEEALEGSEDSHNELSNLQKEGDMPLKDLLAMYGYGDPSTENSNSSDRLLIPSGNGDPEVEGQYSDKGDNDADDDEDDDEADTTSNEPDLKQFYTEMLVKGKDSTSLVSGSTMKGSNAGNVVTGDNSRRYRIHDDDDDDEEGETEECSMIDGCSNSENTRTASTMSGTGTAKCGGITALAGCTTNDNTVCGVESGVSSGTVDCGEDGIVSGAIGSATSRLLRSVSRPQSEEEEDDCDYSPDEEEWKKTIMVGINYQAAIPEGLCHYDDALPYENEDKMLWDPSHIPEEQTEEFLERAQLPAVKGGSLPTGSHIRDDEQALYLLLQCGYNLEEALRRRRMNVVPPTDAVSLWSEEECHNFESGMRIWNKDFHLIQKNKVRTRSVGELVQFYYLWKKTERHDIFTYKARMEKRKYALHPGITDYMDRFLEEQEGVRDRSSSPNVHCLLYGDAKRQRTTATAPNNEEAKSEPWDGATIDPLADMNGPTPGPPPPPFPPPPPPAPTTAIVSPSSSVATTLSTPIYCTTSTRHSDSSPSDSSYANPHPWSNLTSRSHVTSNIGTTVTINTTTTTSTVPTVTVPGITSTATTTSSVISSNNFYNSRVTPRNNNVHDSPSPENILPHLPP
ncbi:mesoderm induction early response protein 1 isoform X2 [Ceratina calcarata]|uniref:Mesoderm induction early response protein 1 isoform X2 n=1 Tax=Ceratina calcarata TaxID=156304 RepID=A0AAJ7N3P7_9HYME|nr:mesoderm induction early response protein 1 isoform X2 [Ceratina calcarata]